MIDDIKDIKPPVNLPFNFIEDLWWFWLILALILITTSVYYFLTHRRRSFELSKLEPAVPAWAKAMRQLEELGVKDLPGQGQWREYYFALSTILRHYIEERFAIKAAEMTTEEFLQKVKNEGVLSEVQKSTLRDFMNIADMVKFARHAPMRDEAQQSFDLVLLFVKATTPNGI